MPQRVRDQLNQRARLIAMSSVGCEVRFVCDAADIDVFVCTTKPEFAGQVEVRVFRGSFEIGRHARTPGVVQELRLGEPPRFRVVDRSRLQQGGFAENVYRLAYDRLGTGQLHGVVAYGHPARRPTPEELPRLKWLAHGSSITCSSLDGYAERIAARHALR